MPQYKHILTDFKDLRKVIGEITKSKPAKTRYQQQAKKMGYRQEAEEPSTDDKFAKHQKKKAEQLKKDKKHAGEEEIKKAYMALGDSAQGSIQYQRSLVQKQLAKMGYNTYSKRVFDELFAVEEESKYVKAARDVVKTKGAKKVDGVLLDLFTASAITKVYDAVNPQNKKKMDGLKLKQLADLAFRAMKKEEIEFDEGKLPVTKDDPLVILHDAKGKLIGHMNLSVAANIHKFKTTGLAKKLAKAGTGKLIRITSSRPGGLVSLSWSEHNKTQMKEARQLKNPKKEVLVVKSGKVIVIDKKDAKKYLNQGWQLAEEVELDEAILRDRDYEYDEKKGVVKISKKNYAKVQKDSKGGTKQKPMMMVLTKKGTILAPVQFEEVELDESVNEGQPVANIAVTGLNSSEARKLAKWLPDLLSIERKTGRYTSKTRDIHKRVSLKGNTVFVSDPGSGIDTFGFETMIRKQLADWKMKGKVGSSTHVQR